MIRNYKLAGVVVTALLTTGIVWAQGAGEGEKPPAIPSGVSGLTLPIPPSAFAPEGEEGKEPAAALGWTEFLEKWLTPIKLEKSMIVRIDDKYCYPHPAVSFKMEIMREDDDYVWVRGLPPEDPESPLHDQWLERENLEAMNVWKDELEEEHGALDYYVDFDAPIVPAPTINEVDFKEVRSGLPDGGSWQMNFALGDLDGDGKVDIATPPVRKGPSRPFVFVNRDDGQFTLWEGTTFGQDTSYDYGAIGVADFNLDGHQDLVLAVHFGAQYILFGDGEGHFDSSVQLKSPDSRITSRAVTVNDFDGDGRPDVAFVGEIDYDMSTQKQLSASYGAWVVLNKADGWVVDTQGMPKAVMADNLDSADVDGDGRVDLVFASNNGVYRRLLYLNTKDGWIDTPILGVLSSSYHHDVEAATTRNGEPRVFATFSQFTTVKGDTQSRTGIIQYQLVDGGLRAPDGPVFFDDQRYNPEVRLGVGDVNGDGILDVVSGRKKGELEVYIQTEDGVWYRDVAKGLKTNGARPYAIELADLDGDGRDDIIASFADSEKVPGGIRVWLATPLPAS